MFPQMRLLIGPELFNSYCRFRISAKTPIRFERYAISSSRPRDIDVRFNRIIVRSSSICGTKNWPAFIAPKSNIQPLQSPLKVLHDSTTRTHLFSQILQWTENFSKE